MKLCRGSCGKEAIYGDWCSLRFQECLGYKKKLSDKAKLRGNNGIRGSLNKKYTINDTLIQEFQLECYQCHKIFMKKLRGETYKRIKNFLCNECIRQKVSKTTIQTYKNKIDLLPYEQKSSRWRKEIIWEEQGKKCNKCEFSKDDYNTGPYELHHIDGNCYNKNRSNEELLCRNCHWYTNNWGFKNRNHTEKSRIAIKNSLLTFNMQNISKENL